MRGSALDASSQPPACGETLGLGSRQSSGNPCDTPARPSPRALPAATLPGTPSIRSCWCLLPALAPEGTGPPVPPPRSCVDQQVLVTLYLPPRGGRGDPGWVR